MSMHGVLNRDHNLSFAFLVLFLALAGLFVWIVFSNEGTAPEIDYSIEKKEVLTSTGSEISGSGSERNYLDDFASFDLLPQTHKNSLGYILVTSHNLDIREQDLPPEEYIVAAYHVQSGALSEVNRADKETYRSLYVHARTYVRLIAERKLDRFSVGFTTKTYANNPKKADIYLSSDAVSSILFVHEFGHVVDYKFGFTDTFSKIYPYESRDNAITEYGKFHIGEDFAEAYRFFVLHSDYFRELAESNKEIKKKYDYMKRYVFGGMEYGIDNGSGSLLK